MRHKRENLSWKRKGKLQFHQFPDESLSEALERFRGLLRKTPTHGLSEPTQLNIFIDRLRLQSKQLLDASAGRKIKLKTPKEAKKWVLRFPVGSLQPTRTVEITPW